MYADGSTYIIVIGRAFHKRLWFKDSSGIDKMDNPDVRRQFIDGADELFLDLLPFCEVHNADINAYICGGVFPKQVLSLCETVLRAGCQYDGEAATDGETGAGEADT